MLFRFLVPHNTRHSNPLRYHPTFLPHHRKQSRASAWPRPHHRFLGAHFVQHVYDDESLQGCSALDPQTKEPCATSVDEAEKISNCTMLIGCVLSHVPRMEYLDDARAISMTMLRRPAQRVPSGYYHGYPHTGTKTRGCGKPPACLPFTEYITLERFQNVAVRMLAANTRPYDEEKAAVTEEHLHLAMAALDKFDAVGINEAFYSSIKLAFVEQGWTFDPDLLLASAHKGDCAFGQKRHCHDLANPNSKRKVKKNKPDYQTFLNNSLAPKDVRDTLARNNNFDQELWEHARDILCRKLSKHRDAVITGDERVIRELQSSNMCPDLGYLSS